MFKDRLKEARKKSGLSQEKLGTLLGVSKQTISDYERGYSDPDMRKVSQIMKHLNIEANFLWQDEMAEPLNDENKPSEAALRIAAMYDLLDPHGKEMLDAIADIESKRVKSEKSKVKHIPIIGIAYNDGRVETKQAAMREQKELTEDIVEINE